MGVIVILEVLAKDGQLPKLIEYSSSLLPETRLQDGFVRIDICRDPEAPNSMVAVEEWETRKAYDAYLQWRVESGVIKRLMAFADSEPSIRYLQPW